jgi:hypothetical protein
MRKVFLLLIPPLLILGGCLSAEQRLVGKWRGKVEMDQTVKSAMGMAGGLASMFQPQLDLRPDKTFSLSLGPAPIEGTWKLEPGQLVLTPKTMMGMSADNVRDRAKRELAKVKKDSPFPIPIPMGEGVPPVLTEMRVAVDGENHMLVLDPGAGTFLAGFGRMVFKKV